MNFIQFDMAKLSVNGVEEVDVHVMSILHRHVIRKNQYKSIGLSVGVYEEYICQRIKRATINPRPRTENSRREEPRSAWSIFA